MSWRSGPRSDRLVVASLTGAAQRNANWHDLDDAETAAAVTELQEIVGDRPDGAALLAEVAGIFIGAHESKLDEARAIGAAQLCIAAGADKTLIPQWIDEGRRRRENTGKPPFSAPSYQRPRSPDAWPTVAVTWALSGGW